MGVVTLSVATHFVARKVVATHVAQAMVGNPSGYR